MSVIGSFNKALKPSGSQNFPNDLEFLCKSLIKNLKTTLPGCSFLRLGIWVVIRSQPFSYSFINNFANFKGSNAILAYFDLVE